MFYFILFEIIGYSWFFFGAVILWDTSRWLFWPDTFHTKFFQKVDSSCGTFENMKIKKKSRPFLILKDLCMLKLFS